MDMSRRSVIAAAASAGVLALTERQAAAQTPMAAAATRTRYNATSAQGKAMLGKYAQAVTKMKSLSKTDPRNWDFQWYTHWIPGPNGWQPSQPVKAQMIASVFGSAPPNDPHRLLAQAMWDTCQAHARNPNDPNDFQEQFFLPWHRFFVYYFEEIIRGVLGDPSFTLPYWNYLSSKADDRIMPAEFRDPGSPLFVQNRNSWVNAGQPIDSTPQAIPLNNNAFRENIYIRFCSGLDNNPHGAVHVDVGTQSNMGYVPTAAQDPVFWVHHCEIDRLWESWNRLPGHANPAWPDRSFVYADATGKAAIRKCKDADRVALLNYQYDSYYVPPFQVAAPPVAMAFGAPPETTRAAGAGPLQLTAGGARIALRPPAAISLGAPAADADAARRALFDRGPGQQLYLVLGDISVQGPVARAFHIYLDLPAGQTGGGPSDPHYVDTLHFFGIEPRDPGSPHGDHARSFNVTETVRVLAERNLLTPTPTVTALPAGDAAGLTPLVVGRVALVAG